MPDTYAAPTSQMTSTFRAAATDPNAAIKEIVVTVDNRTGIASYSIQRNPNCKLTPLPVNNPPVFPNISPISVTTGTAGNQTLPPASDPDGDTITYSVSTLPPGFTFSTSTRVLSWTANT